MNLTEWNSRLQQHFEELWRQRLAAAGDKPIFVLEHGLGVRDLQDLTTEIRSHIVASPPDDEHRLPWIVYQRVATTPSVMNGNHCVTPPPWMALFRKKY